MQAAAAAPVAAPAATSNPAKRGRDNSSNVARFKQEIYGTNGFQKLMAMVERNPAIMYPPEGCVEARERAILLGISEFENNPQMSEKERQLAEDKAHDKDIGALLDEFDGVQNETMTSSSALPQGAPTATELPARDAEEEDFLARLLALREGRQQVPPQKDSPGAGRAAQASPEAAAEEAAAADPAPAPSSDPATYHRQQLTAFMATLYEFNHVTFSKLQIRDFLLQLLRCGRESYANIVDFETRVRLERFGDMTSAAAGNSAVASQYLDQLKADGREAYFDSQLQNAEARAAALETAPDGVWGNAVDLDAEDDGVDDDDLWEELRRKQARIEDVTQHVYDEGEEEHQQIVAQGFSEPVAEDEHAARQSADPIESTTTEVVQLPESLMLQSTGEAVPPSSALAPAETIVEGSYIVEER